MNVSKVHILDEIKRTAAANLGVPLGVDRFESETGIKLSDWYGVHWARWSEAVREAGFKPNTMNRPLDRGHVLECFAALARELGQLPVEGDFMLKRKRDREFPNRQAFAKLGAKDQRIAMLAEYCRATPGYESVLELCEDYLRSTETRQSSERAADDAIVGFVYLIKHGARREYKLGRTSNALRREGEIGIELPEKVQPIHVIKTDDPSGIEAYWHNRFDAKRKNGEWFELNAADVSAFKRRKFM